MEDFGNILYVLVMIAAFAFSAIRKSKQSKRRPPVPDHDDSAAPYSPMDEEEPIIEELRDLFKPKTPRPQVVQQPEKTVQNTPVQTTKAKPEINRTSKPIKRLEVEDSEEQNNEFGFDTNDIDLRKAVIYSEILNRPYQ